MGKTLNLFAGKTKLKVDEIRNDINQKISADFHLDAYDFLNQWQGDKFDTVILDPPYSLRKAYEKYDGKYMGSRYTRIKDLIPSVLNVGGRVIALGYNSIGMGIQRGFQKVAVCLVCHGGDHNDTICVVDEFVQGIL